MGFHGILWDLTVISGDFTVAGDLRIATQRLFSAFRSRGDGVTVFGNFVLSGPANRH
jgi:hypothetical protein